MTAVGGLRLRVRLLVRPSVCLQPAQQQDRQPPPTDADSKAAMQEPHPDFLCPLELDVMDGKTRLILWLRNVMPSSTAFARSCLRRFGLYVPPPPPAPIICCKMSPLVDQKCINLRYAGMIARPLRDGFASATVKCVARRASGEVFRV